ncbi:hypothetical protein GJ496_008771 [Pomphorhynchus laevis]|nr:hypothetical protein GJ496_008771 [Pomphorhynchus laevis]
MSNNTNKILKNATKLPSKQSKHTNYSKHKSTKLKVKKLKKSQKHKKAVDLIKCDSSSNDNKVKLIKSVTDNSTSWINEQRLLIFSSRGISCLARHVMKNLNGLLPHSRCGAKLDTKRDLNVVIKENMDERNCNKVLFFEMRKKKDLYLWAAAGPDGPTVKFFVQNVHSMEELRMTGNCLRASRPILSFDKRFEETKNNVHLTLIKELLVQCFGCPKNHPRSQPFIDHVFTFSWIDGRIWFRNYQIIDSKLGKLAEIGPR